MDKIKQIKELKRKISELQYDLDTTSAIDEDDYYESLVDDFEELKNELRKLEETNANG